MTEGIKILRIIKKTGFFEIFGSSVFNKIVTFMSSVILVRILTKSEYGIFIYSWNIYSIVLLTNGLGMESGVLQMCSERSGDIEFARRICNYGSRFGILFDTLLMVVLLGISALIPLKIEKAKELLILLCLLPLFQLLFNLTTSYLRSQKRNRDYVKTTVINTLLVFGFSATGAFIFREKGMVFGYYVAYTVSVLLSIFWFHIHLITKDNFLEQKDKKALIYIAVVSMCNNGLSQMMYLLDVFILGIIDPQETILASYKVATIIPSALTFIPLSLITYLYPYFAEHRMDGKWCLNRYKQILVAIGTLNAVISAGLFIMAPFVIKIIFGSEYLDAVPVFRILSINYFLSGTFRIISGNLLVTQRRLKYNLLVAVVSGGVNIIADFILIQWWGSIGAAFTSVLVVIVSSVMSTTYLVYTFRKVAKMQVFEQ